MANYFISLNFRVEYPPMVESFVREPGVGKLNLEKNEIDCLKGLGMWIEYDKNLVCDTRYCWYGPENAGKVDISDCVDFVSILQKALPHFEEIVRDVDDEDLSLSIKDDLEFIRRYVDAVETSQSQSQTVGTYWRRLPNQLMEIELLIDGQRSSNTKIVDLCSGRILKMNINF
jgi:hypothetical protein